MLKCSKAEVRRLRIALRWKIPAAQRQRIQMVLLHESAMAQPAIAAAMGGIAVAIGAGWIAIAIYKPWGQPNLLGPQ